MPTVAIVDGVKILFYADDHAPPHFHALFAEHEATIDIQTLTVRRGSLPRAKLASVLFWSSSRRTELLAAWLTAQEKRKPGRIA